MYPKIKVYGLASQKQILSSSVLAEQLEWSLLRWLTFNQIPVASSCSGVGVCKKCSIQDEILTCQIKVGEWIKKTDTMIILSYL